LFPAEGDRADRQNDPNASRPDYPRSTPPQAVVKLNMPVFAGLTAADAALVERHFRSSLRWEIREEHYIQPKRTKRTAIRLRPPAFQVTLNGFYSDFSSKGVVQTRVLVGFGQEYGFGNSGLETRVQANAKQAQLVLEKYMDQPGLQSCLVVQGGAGLTLEIFEQAHPKQRAFTQKVLQEFEAELAGALAARKQIEQKGYAKALVPPGSVHKGKPSMKVDDGLQPGIFVVTAWVYPGTKGVCRLKVFFEGPAKDAESGTLGVPAALKGRTGLQLSADRMDNRSRRHVAWSKEPETLFRYQSEVTVYEGDWKHRYRARFELWFQPDKGPERRLLSVTRIIAGWQR
jgi:hypothetical protein